MAKQVDWEIVERDYRAGVKSLRAIAGEHGVTEGAIRKRARRDEWERDLTERIKQKADALVRNKAVRTELRAADREAERTVVEANAEAIANVILTHRGDIRETRVLVTGMVEELKILSENRDVIYELCKEVSRDPDGKISPRQLEAFHRALGLGGRVVNVEALTRALKNVITLEREAFGIKSEGGESEPAMPLVIHDTYPPPESA
ncbi:MAG: hypothetical protein AB7Q97_01755 [Gammaproteobacteria bacterium]